MKLIGAIIITILVLSRCHDSEVTEKSFVSLNECDHVVVDSFGEGLTKMYKNDSCDLIQYFNYDKNATLLEAAYYDDRGKLTLKVKKIKDSLVYLLPDVFVTNNFQSKYYTGESIYLEYFSIYKFDSNRTDLCTLVEQGNLDKFELEVSQFISDYYSFGLTQNEISNLYFFLENSCQHGVK